MSYDHPNKPHERPFRKVGPLRHVNYHVNRLLELRNETEPAGEATTETEKDLNAHDALRHAGELVNILAGWAVDHEIGLGLAGLSFVPIQPTKTTKHPEYLEAKEQANSHEHEQRGRTAYDITDSAQPVHAASCERQALINLLIGNPGAFPEPLTLRLIEALEALDHGEVQELLAPAKTNLRANPYSRWRLEMKALQHVEYFYARGNKKGWAQRKVGLAYGLSPNTVRNWERNLRQNLGQLHVSRNLAFASTAGLNIEAAHQGKLDKQEIRFRERVYGEEALAENGRQYQALLREED